MCAHRLTPCTPRASMELDYESFDAPPVANPQSDRPMLRHRLSRLPGHLAEILVSERAHGALSEALFRRSPVTALPLLAADAPRTPPRRDTFAGG